VRINYKTPGNYFPIPIERSIPDRAVVDVKPEGLQWAKLYESDSLRSIGTAERQFNLCVNVYAQNTPKQPLFTTDEVKYCISDTVVFKNASVGAYNSYEWNFGVGATPQTATTASVTDSFKVAYATPGIKKVVLKATDGVLTDSIVKGNAVEILSGVPLHIISSATNDSILKNNRSF
jgi:PKD repeat protein